MLMPRIEITRRQVIGTVELTSKGSHPLTVAFDLIGRFMADEMAKDPNYETDAIEFRLFGRHFEVGMTTEPDDDEIG